MPPNPITAPTPIVAAPTTVAPSRSIPPLNIFALVSLGGSVLFLLWMTVSLLMANRDVPPPAIQQGPTFQAPILATGIALTATPLGLPTSTTPTVKPTSTPRTRGTPRPGHTPTVAPNPTARPTATLRPTFTPTMTPSPTPTRLPP